MRLFDIFLKSILLSSILLSCSQKWDDSHPLAVKDGKWGHLNYINEQDPSFLINYKKSASKPYTICTSYQIEKDFPNITNELEATLQIWGYYIDRTIPVEFKLIDHPYPEKTIEIIRLEKSLLDVNYEQDNKKFKAIQDQIEDQIQRLDSDYLESAYAKCGDNTNIFFGYGIFSPFSEALAKTWFYHKSNMRGLFIRDYKQFPEFYIKDNQLQVSRDYLIFKDLNQKGIEYQSVNEIIQMLINEKSVIEDKAPETTLLPTLMHEFGHVWGLCDQYEAGTKACDPNNSSHYFDEKTASWQHLPIFKSIMAGSGRIKNLYLQEDDIIGIQQLAKRENFKHDWPEISKAKIVELPKEYLPKKIHYVSFVDYSQDPESDFKLLVKFNYKTEYNREWFKFDKNNNLVGSNFTYKLEYFNEKSHQWLVIDFNDNSLSLGQVVQSLSFYQINTNREHKIRLTLQLFDEQYVCHASLNESGECVRSSIPLVQSTLSAAGKTKD